MPRLRPIPSERGEPPPKPTTHNGDLARLPTALAPRAQEKRWVAWKWTWRPEQGRWDKPPLQASNPVLSAKSNDPATWDTYAAALAAVQAGHADGVGYMLAGGDLGAVDLDHCHDPQTGKIEAWAQQEIDAAAGAYVEITVSGKGLRILGIGAGDELGRKWKIPNAANGAAIEVYRRTNRYITISGAQIAGGTELPSIDAALDDIARRFDIAKPEPPKSVTTTPHSADLDDLIKNGAPRGIRSEMFSKVVWTLAAQGCSLDQIKQELVAHPNGIASKYADQDGRRLERETERCFRKWEIKNPKPATPAPKWPDLSDEGEPKRTYRNARAAITALGVVCSYDEFHDRMLVAGHPINQWAGELSDAVNVVLRQLIIDKFDFDPGKDNIVDAATELCLENRFNPILDYIDGIDWDGKPRLDKWLATYLGAEDSDFNSAIGRLALVAAIRRVRKPGCKFDHILTLEGSEGTMKSTSIVTLASVGNFSDQTILTASDKEQQELVRGVWLYEIADLAGMRRADVEKIKAFASRTHDRARPAYGRRRIDAPRRCIFIATTNEDEYLQSQTGNRRFWPTKTGGIDIDALRLDRDQLWAEAAEIEAKGDPLILPKDLWSKASEAQDERRHHDPWDDTLAGIQGHACVNEETGKEEERISSDELLKTYLELPPGKAQNTDAQRLKRSMRRLGWSGPKKLRFGNELKRGYFR